MTARATRFTLIELLVVVAIIAVIASMLLPALAQARETAKRSLCLSNQKQFGTAFVMFEDDYGRLPNYKNQGYYWSLIGQPIDNSAPGCAVTTYGHQDYPLFFANYAPAGVAGRTDRRYHSWIPTWTNNGLQKCPSANHSPFANDAPKDGDVYNLNTDFQRWGALRIFYYSGGMNILYAPAAIFNGGSLKWLSERRTTRMVFPEITTGVYESCTIIGPANHRGKGMNLLTMDGAGRWVQRNECFTDTSGRYMNQYDGDPPAGSIHYIPSNYAIVSSGWPNMNVYVPARDGKPAYTATHTAVGGLADQFAKLGFTVSQW